MRYDFRSDLIACKENKPPLVIGIHGEWGSGKTTLMETVRKMLRRGIDVIQRNPAYEKQRGYPAAPTA